MDIFQYLFRALLLRLDFHYMGSAWEVCPDLQVYILVEGQGLSQCKEVVLHIRRSLQIKAISSVKAKLTSDKIK